MATDFALIPESQRCGHDQSQSRYRAGHAFSTELHPTVVRGDEARSGDRSGRRLPEVEGAITRARVSADKILLTHGHVDHVQREYIYVPDAAVTAGKRR